MQLACMVISLQHSTCDNRDIVSSKFVVGETYERGFGMVVRIVLRLVGGEADKIPKDI